MVHEAKYLKGLTKSGGFEATAHVVAKHFQKEPCEAGATIWCETAGRSAADCAKKFSTLVS